MKSKKKCLMGAGSGWGNQGGCEQRIEVFVQIHKTIFLGGEGWVRGGGMFT